MVCTRLGSWDSSDHSYNELAKCKAIVRSNRESCRFGHGRFISNAWTRHGHVERRYACYLVFSLHLFRSDPCARRFGFFAFADSWRLADISMDFQTSGPGGHSNLLEHSKDCASAMFKSGDRSPARSKFSDRRWCTG